MWEQVIQGRRRLKGLPKKTAGPRQEATVHTGMSEMLGVASREICRKPRYEWASWVITETAVGTWSVAIGKFSLKTMWRNKTVLGGCPVVKVPVVDTRLSFLSVTTVSVLWLSYTAVVIRTPKYGLNKGWYGNAERRVDVKCVWIDGNETKGLIFVFPVREQVGNRF